MNRLEHLLVILGEECSELHQESCKALRFGVHEQRDLPTSNLDRMTYEYSQLVAMLHMLQDEGVNVRLDYNIVAEKKAKVEKYLAYSHECGTLTGEGNE